MLNYTYRRTTEKKHPPISLIVPEMQKSQC